MRWVMRRPVSSANSPPVPAINAAQTIPMRIRLGAGPSSKGSPPWSAVSS